MEQELPLAKIKLKVEPPFRKLYEPPGTYDIIVAIGGRGGMKTYEISKYAAFASTIRERRIAVLRDEKETIRESILNEIFLRYDTANKSGHFDGLFDKTQSGIRNLTSGEMQVFTKGFRASSNEKKSNLKGASDVDVVIIEEAEDIRDPHKFNTFTDSIRTEGRLIIVMLNTPDIQHWIVKRYFTLQEVTVDDVPECPHLTADDLDGYWKLVPKDLKRFGCIQTSYEDNKHLPEAIIDSYKAYGQPDSPTYDLHYYLTAIKGFASAGRRGQVLRKVKPIKLADYMALPFREIYGLDFGTSAPAGIVGVKQDGNRSYCRRLNYKPMSTLLIAVAFARLGIDPENDIVIADSADPLSIGKLRRGFNFDAQGRDELSPELRAEFPNGIPGINIRGVVKGSGSVEFGLGLLNSKELYAVEEHEELWNEVYNYIYAQNKSGEYTNLPIDEYNHLIDPWRYVEQSKGRHY